MFDWLQSKKPPDQPDYASAGRFVDARAVFDDLCKRVPQYVEDTDQGRLIYPACKRSLKDASGDISSVWDHTRLEALRYLTMLPTQEAELLTDAEQQTQMMNAFLLQRPHDETVVDFTGTPITDYAIAIQAGLNWLTHCARLAGVHPSKHAGTISNFRHIVTVAQKWWFTDGALERASEMRANGGQPPVMLYLAWSDYTRLAKRIVAASVFENAVGHAPEMFGLPADILAQFDAAREPFELAAESPQ